MFHVIWINHFFSSPLFIRLAFFDVDAVQFPNWNEKLFSYSFSTLFDFESEQNENKYGNERGKEELIDPWDEVNIVYFYFGSGW